MSVRCELQPRAAHPGPVTGKMVKRRCRRHRPGLRESGPFVVSGAEAAAWQDGTEGLEGSPDARARAQAQPGRADEAGEEPALDDGRAAGADRDGLRRHRGGGSRPAQVVGPLPRQAEDRDLHAADQAARRADHARAAARDRRALERARPRRRRADDPPDDPAPLPRAHAPCRRSSTASATSA